MKNKFVRWKLWSAPSHKLKGRKLKGKKLKAVMQLGAVSMTLQACIKVK